MCSPPDSIPILQMLVRLTNARRVVEVGVFTGCEHPPAAISTVCVSCCCRRRGSGVGEWPADHGECSISAGSTLLMVDALERSNRRAMTVWSGPAHAERATGAPPGTRLWAWRWRSRPAAS